MTPEKELRLSEIDGLYKAEAGCMCDRRDGESCYGCSPDSKDFEWLITELRQAWAREADLVELLIDIEISPRILHEINLVENMQNIARKALARHREALK